MAKSKEITQQKVLVRAQMKVVLRQMMGFNPASESYALLNEEYEALRTEHTSLTSQWMEAKRDEKEPVLV